jgi:hypothetical protein
MRNEVVVAAEAPTAAPSLARATAAAVVAVPLAAVAPATAAVATAPPLAAIVLPEEESATAAPPSMEQGTAVQGRSPLWLALAALVILPAGIGIVGYVAWRLVRRAV